MVRSLVPLARRVSLPLAIPVLAAFIGTSAAAQTSSTTSYCADQTLPAAGPTGPRIGQSSNSTATTIGQLVALRP